MKYLKYGALLLLLGSFPASAQQVTRLCVQGSTGNCIPVDSTAPLPVTDSSGGATTANQGTPNAGGAANSWPVQGAGVAGTPAGGVASVQGVSGGTNLPVSQATAANLNATVVGTGTFAVQPSNTIGITPTDATITSATGSSQPVMALNASRHSLIIQNTGNANCGVNPTGGTAAIGGDGTLTLFPGGSYQPRVPTLSAVTAICTSGQPLYAEQN